jgi:hypothetical protein
MKLTGKPEELGGKNLSQCHFVHHKSHMDSPGSNPGLRSGRPAANRLSHGTALFRRYCSIVREITSLKLSANAPVTSIFFCSATFLAFISLYRGLYYLFVLVLIKLLHVTLIEQYVVKMPLISRPLALRSYCADLAMWYYMIASEI